MHFGCKSFIRIMRMRLFKTNALNMLPFLLGISHIIYAHILVRNRKEKNIIVTFYLKTKILTRNNIFFTLLITRRSPHSLFLGQSHSLFNLYFLCLYIFLFFIFLLSFLLFNACLYFIVNTIRIFLH